MELAKDLTTGITTDIIEKPQPQPSEENSATVETGVNATGEEQKEDPQEDPKEPTDEEPTDVETIEAPDDDGLEAGVIIELPPIPTCDVCTAEKADAVERSITDIKSFPAWEDKRVCDDCRQSAYIKKAKESQVQTSEPTEPTEDQKASDANQWKVGNRYRYVWLCVPQDETKKFEVIQYTKKKLSKKEVTQHKDRLVKLHHVVAVEMKAEVKLTEPPKAPVQPTPTSNPSPSSSRKGQPKPYVPNVTQDEAKKDMGYPHKYTFDIDGVYKDQYAQNPLKEETIEKLKTSYARMYKTQKEITFNYTVL